MVFSTFEVDKKIILKYTTKYTTILIKCHWCICLSL